MSEINTSGEAASEVECKIPQAPPVPERIPPKVCLKRSTNVYVLEEENVHKILPGLYLGAREAARSKDTLNKRNVTHILTIEDRPLEHDVHKNFAYKYIKMADYPTSNLLDVLEECIEFIEHALGSSGTVLVHCLAGVSRSASIVIAYIMKKEKKSFNETFDFVCQYRPVSPNYGFRKQLRIYEAMNFTVNRKSHVYRAFRLNRHAKHIQLTGMTESSWQKEKTDDIVATNIAEDDETACYKCKRCRTTLFTAKQTIKHLIDSDKQSEHFDTNYYKDLAEHLKANSNKICNSEIYIEPMDWFQDRLSETNGKINCPKCDAKLGSFDWCGSMCACGSWITPSFHISLSKVDYCKQ